MTDQKCPETALNRAAAEWGIERVYYDIRGERHEADPEVLKAILWSLGVNTSSDQAIEAELKAKHRAEESRPLPPVIVISQEAKSLPLPISANVCFHWEDGSSSDKLRNPLPLGYHEISVKTGCNIWPRSRLIVCPDRVYAAPQRAAGIGISLYALRSSRNWGCGDLSDLKAFITWAASALEISFIALNPLHAIANRTPFNTSPYLPNSIFYKNLIYLDIEQLPEFPACGQLSRGVRAEIERLRESEYVEYERVARLKTRMLRFLFRRFLDDQYRLNTPRAREFKKYVEAEGELLERFALYCVLDETMRHGNRPAWHWAEWPLEYRDPESAATREFADAHRRSLLFHKYVQWQLELQLGSAQAHAKKHGLSIGLYHDLALATDRFGSDVWAHRDFYIEGCRVGSPPDDFSPTGQDWGFPPPNSQRHYEDGYRLFADSIRKNARHGGALRIDHVMRFFHLFWIPEGMPATQGTYVADRARDLLHVLALESVRGRFAVIGEDLGTVPDEVRETLAEFGVLSYRLLYFEKNRDGEFKSSADYPGQALVSTTTHDLPTLAGFWNGRDIEARRAAGILPGDEAYRRMKLQRAQEKLKLLALLKSEGFLSESYEEGDEAELSGEVHSAVTGFLASTRCRLFLLTAEDLLKSPDQQNLPGTTAEYPNWRRKLEYTLEELRDKELPHKFASMFRYWVEKTGRGYSPGARETH